MKIIYFLSFFWVSTFSYAINGNNSITVNSKYVIDSNSSWKINDLYKKSFIPFKTNSNLNIGYNKNATIWCLFTFKNKTPKHQNANWLVFDNNHIDSLVFYDQNRILFLGDRTKFSSNFLDGQCFKIILKPNESREIMVKLKKTISFFEFSYYIEKEEVLQFNSLRKITFSSFFLGAIFILLLFNSVLYFITKNKLYLLYILYSLLTTLYISISTSYLKNYIFIDFLYFSELRIYASCLWFVSLSLFITFFLDLKTNQPIKYRIIFISNIFIISAIIVSLFLLHINILHPLQLLFSLTYLSFVIIFIFLAIATISHFRIDKKNSIYILLAFFPQFVWGTFFLINSFGFISNNYHYDWLVIISLYEVMLFGYVLTKSYLITFRKNNELILEVISEKEKSFQLITQVQIRERRTIANIIHDNLGSKIAYVLQLMQLNNITQASDNIRELAIDIREISHKILPKSLDEGALLDSIQSHIDIMNISFNSLKIELFNYDFPENIEEIWIYDLYLMTVEVINNSINHGQASNILIEFYSYPDNYQFQFTDDGVGFDVKNSFQGFGLENIEKRVINYNGIFEINSSVNQGTIIQISIPK